MRRKKTALERLDRYLNNYTTTVLPLHAPYFKRLLREVAKEAYIYGHADGGLNIIKSYELKKALKEVLGK